MAHGTDTNLSVGYKEVGLTSSGPRRSVWVGGYRSVKNQSSSIAGMYALIMYLAAERYSSPEVDIVPSDGPGVPSDVSLMAIEKMTSIKGVGNFEGTKVGSGGASELLKRPVRRSKS